MVEAKAIYKDAVDGLQQAKDYAELLGLKFAYATNGKEINVAVHYNSWDNLAPEDFEPVVVAFRNLIAGFTCPDCGEYLRVSPDRETSEVIRCECGKTALNLRQNGWECCQPLGSAVARP